MKSNHSRVAFCILLPIFVLSVPCRNPVPFLGDTTVDLNKMAFFHALPDWHSDSFKYGAIDFSCDQKRVWTDPMTGNEYDLPDGVDIRSIARNDAYKNGTWLLKTVDNFTNLMLSQFLDIPSDSSPGAFMGSSQFLNLRLTINWEKKYVVEVSLSSVEHVG